jgi:hypothetical protein
MVVTIAGAGAREGAVGAKEEPFRVLYNYRKTKMLRKMRELRKERVEKEKLERRWVLDAIKVQKQSLVNRSMFDCDDQWENCYESFKMFKEQYLEESSTGQEQLPAKSRQELIIEAIAAIPTVEKTPIFQEGFASFSFRC